MMYFVALDDEVGDGSLGVGAVDGDAKSVAAAPGLVPARKGLLNVVDVVLQKFYVRACSHHTYPQGCEPMLGSMKVADLETFDPYVTLIVEVEYGLSSRGREMICVEDRRFAGITSECDESITRVAGRIDADEFF